MGAQFVGGCVVDHLARQLHHVHLDALGAALVAWTLLTWKSGLVVGDGRSSLSSWAEYQCRYRIWHGYWSSVSLPGKQIVSGLHVVVLCVCSCCTTYFPHRDTLRSVLNANHHAPRRPSLIDDVTTKWSTAKRRDLIAWKHELILIFALIIFWHNFQTDFAYGIRQACMLYPRGTCVHFICYTNSNNAGQHQRLIVADQAYMLVIWSPSLYSISLDGTMTTNGVHVILVFFQIQKIHLSI